MVLNRKEYIAISSAFAILGLIAVVIGAYYLFLLLNYNALAGIVFGIGLIAVSSFLILRRPVSRKR